MSERRRFLALGVCGALTLLFACASDLPQTQDSAESLPRTIVLAQDGPGDVIGSDEVALRAAIGQLPAAGGVVHVRAGTYYLRNTVRLPSHVTLRGEAGTILALPPPTHTLEPAAPGALSLKVASTQHLLAGTILESFPPHANWDPPVSLEQRAVPIAHIEGNVLHLAAPLTIALEAGARLGYNQNLLLINSGTDITLEDLTFHGGRLAQQPMPGHHRRCGVWVGARFTHAGGPKDDPSTRVLVRRCHFSDFYGRAIAFYNATHCGVEHCTIERVDDEAIDFDHFTYDCRAVDNTIRDAQFGVVINDGSRNLVARNVIERCGIGINLWWLPSIVPTDVNRENVIEDNTVTASSEAALSIGERCTANIVRGNRLEGLVRIEGEGNVLEDNERR